MSLVVELYRFTQGAMVWTWTSGDSAVVHAGETYTPYPIGRNGFTQGTDIHKASLQVKVPRNNPIGLANIQYPQEAVQGLTIFEKEGAGFKVSWKGRILNSKLSGSEITLNCESVFTSQRRPGLRRRFQKTCPYALYGRGCKVVKADFAVPGTAASVAGTTITVAAAAGYPSGYFTAGIAETADGTPRLIVEHSGSSLTLMRPFQGLSVGDVVTISPGCDQTEEVCHTRFNNLLNNGSFKRQPAKNPMGGSSIL